MSSSQRYESPDIGLSGWSRWIWKQVTSMRTALVLLLLLAVAAVPGSIYPQRSADPNGVAQFFKNEPDLAKALDLIQLFDVYTSVWFSSIYILLFVSLIGCVVPRTNVHYKALLAEPVGTPSKLSRMPVYRKVVFSKNTDPSEAGLELLRKRGYRVVRRGNSVSAEKGYLRETGNLVFHFSLIGVLIAVGIGGGLSFSGQRVLVEGDTFVNNLAGYDSLSPGTFFDPDKLVPFSVTLDKFEVDYDILNQTNIGTPLDFRATITKKMATEDSGTQSLIRVNQPLDAPGASIYLTGHGYAPVLTIRDGNGDISFSGPTVYLPQDGNMTSIGVIKVPDNMPEQLGIISFFYPSAAELTTGAFTSVYPEPINPLLSMNVYTGDLGLDGGIPKNVFSLNTDGLLQVAGRSAEVPGLEMTVGETVDLPNGLGTVTFDGLRKFASLDIAYNPGQGWVLLFSLLSLLGVIISLLTPRRRVWVKKVSDGFEVAALSRRDDPQLEKTVEDLIQNIKKWKK